METYNWLTLGPGLSRESMMLWGLFAVVLLYLARTHAHHLLLSVTRLLARGLRGFAALLWRLRKRVQILQTEMLVSAVHAEAERRLDNDFKGLAKRVHGELSAYPTLHREVNALATLIERDYEASVEIPPEPPNWLEAVDAVANTASAGDSALAEILDGMHSTLTRASQDVIEEYRYASHKRHLLLRRTASYWRKVVVTLQRMERVITDLSDHVLLADAHMRAFRQLSNETPMPSLTTQLRYLSRFILAILMLVGFGVVAASELALLREPMMQLIKVRTPVFGWPLSEIGAWALVGTPVLLGGILLELGQFTRLMAPLGALPARLRSQLGVLLAVLVLLQVAFVGALVALGTTPPVGHSLVSAPLFAAVGLSLLLSILLLGAELPLEAALRSGRQVCMSLIVGSLGLSALFLRLMAWAMHLAGRVLVRLYDLVIFLPLIIDEAWTARRQRNNTVSAKRLES